MLPILRANLLRSARSSALLRWLLLAVLLVVLPGCATNDADLNYTRDQPTDTNADHSYHGWNNANY